MDIQLHYVEKGKGKPLVLLHGNGSSLDYFQNQIETFSKFYRVFAAALLYVEFAVLKGGLCISKVTPEAYNHTVLDFLEK